MLRHYSQVKRTTGYQSRRQVNIVRSMDPIQCIFDCTFSINSEQEFQYCPQNVAFTEDELTVLVDCLKQETHMIVADSLRKKNLLDSDRETQQEAWEVLTAEVNRLMGASRRVFEVQSEVFVLKSQG